MSSFSKALRRAALLALVSAGQTAMAQEFIYPSQPSTVDDIIVGSRAATGCAYNPHPSVELHTTGAANEGTPDATFAHEMVIDLSGDVDQVCASPIPPDSYEGYRLGMLPEGFHSIDIRAVRDGDTLGTSSVAFHVRDIAGPAVSGAWYAPEQSGRGIFVMRMPLQDGQFAGDNLFSLYWANHTADGKPTWTLVTGLMSDNLISGTAINTSGSPLAPGAADLTQSTWGTASFEYKGCGKATLSWDADDPAITDGSIDVFQLATPDSLKLCTLPSGSSIYEVTRVD